MQMQTMLTPEWLQRRGPDSQQSVWIHSSFSSSLSFSQDEQQQQQQQILLQASVLCLREQHVPQPVKIRLDEKTICGYFCWNGEVYQEFPDESDCELLLSSPSSLDQYQSDTAWMADQIRGILLHTRDNKLAIVSALSQLLSRINGEFAFVLVVLPMMNHNHHGRDSNTGSGFSSNGAGGIYFGRDAVGRRSLVMTSTTTTIVEGRGAIKTGQCWQVASVIAAEPVPCADWVEVPPAVVGFHDLETRQTIFHDSWWSNNKPIVLTHRLMLDLPLHSTSGSRADSLVAAHQQLDWGEQYYQDGLYQVLKQAVKRRLRLAAPGNGGDRNPDKFHKKVAILFSGGLDSTVLAYLALELIVGEEDTETATALELVNVSFVDDDDDDDEQPDNKDNNTQKKTAVLAADTKAAQESFQDLQRLFPNSTTAFRLVHRQVSWRDIQHVQNTRIRPQLLPPKNVNGILDVNVATALWFAAETATARILLTGLGADEYLAGYGRHKQAAGGNEGGRERLEAELKLDQDRLWERNCGRDDRVLSDLGKEVRYPFLDVNVTHYLQHVVPLEYRCKLLNQNHFAQEQPQQQFPADKYLLRRLAWELQLPTAATAVKRAIQFGSRLSHVVDKQRFGSRRYANKKKKEKIHGTI